MRKIIKGYLKKWNVDETLFLYGLAGLVGICAVGLAVWFGWGYIKNRIAGINDDAGIGVSTQDDIEKECEFRRLLDGVCVGSADEVNPKLVAVMIENHPNSRPQSGLSQARVVYEAPVESNYSRFMAIFPLGEEFKKVGPVRSARPYYLDWISEYGQIMYMHVGGSPDALEKIKEEEIFDLNEFYRGWYYWRADDRNAPHNVYTSSELWERAWEEYGNDLTPDADSQTPMKNWKFGEREQCSEDCVGQVTVSFLPPTYSATWKFSSSTDTYERYQMEYPHVDANGTAIQADTIVVIHVETEVVDSIGRILMSTIGEGEATVFRDGYMIPAHWYKGSREEKLELRDIDFHEIPLKPGKIWVEVLNQSSKLEVGD